VPAGRGSKTEVGHASPCPPHLLGHYFDTHLIVKRTGTMKDMRRMSGHRRAALGHRCARASRSAVSHRAATDPESPIWLLSKCPSRSMVRATFATLACRALRAAGRIALEAIETGGEAPLCQRIECGSRTCGPRIHGSRRRGTGGRTEYRTTARSRLAMIEGGSGLGGSGIEARLPPHRRSAWFLQGRWG